MQTKEQIIQEAFENAKRNIERYPQQIHASAYIEGLAVWYQNGTAKATVQEISFWGKNWQDKTTLKDIPAIFYSEVMADIDKLIQAT
jgi:hypothetical protein